MKKEEQLFIERLYTENVEALYYYAYCIVKDWDVAKNLVGDTFVDAIRKSDQLQTHESPRGWLREALKRNIKQHIRRQTQHVLPTVPLDAAVQIESDHTAELLLVLLREVLSEDDYRLFTLHDLRGYSHEQLAKEFGISVSASQKRLERIRKRLRKVVAEK